MTISSCPPGSQSPPSKAEDCACRDCELAVLKVRATQGPARQGARAGPAGVAWSCTRGDSAATGTGRAPCSPWRWGRPTALAPDLGEAHPDGSATRSQTSVPRHPGPPVTAHQRVVARGASWARFRPPPPETAVLTATSHTVTRGHRRPRTQRGPGPGRQSLLLRPLAGPETTQTKPADRRPPPGFPLLAGEVTLTRRAGAPAAGGGTAVSSYQGHACPFLRRLTPACGRGGSGPRSHLGEASGSVAVRDAASHGRGAGPAGCRQGLCCLSPAGSFSTHSRDHGTSSCAARGLVDTLWSTGHGLASAQQAWGPSVPGRSCLRG